MAHQVGVVEPHRFLVRARVCWIRFDATKKMAESSSTNLPTDCQCEGNSRGGINAAFAWLMEVPASRLHHPKWGQDPAASAATSAAGWQLDRGPHPQNPPCDSSPASVARTQSDKVFFLFVPPRSAMELGRRRQRRHPPTTVSFLGLFFLLLQ